MFSRSLALTCAIAFASAAALAQPAEAPAEVAPVKPTCVKRHDHGAERQSATFNRDCKPAAAKVAKAGKKKESGIQGHDHGKIHKNQ